MLKNSVHIHLGRADVPSHFTAGAVAIGNFDGVHLGHRAVLGKAIEFADAKGGPAVALTFEPHPRSLFQPDVSLFRLTPGDMKAQALLAAGMSDVLVLPFDHKFSEISAEAFIEEILIETLNCRHVAIGYDFKFGKGRKGDADLLAQYGAQNGFEVVAVSAKTTGTDPISSSAIRAALAAGEIAKASALMGRPWRFASIVQHGDKRGRTLGYPTANLQLPAGATLAHGIYAVKIQVQGRSMDGVASYGRRPMFDNGKPLFEIHIFDFKQDIYEKEVEVDVIAWQRPELTFDSVQALIDQMDQDSIKARDILKSISFA